MLSLPVRGTTQHNFLFQWFLHEPQFAWLSMNGDQLPCKQLTEQSTRT
jgi:hypothetical protein